VRHPDTAAPPGKTSDDSSPPRANSRGLIRNRAARDEGETGFSQTDQAIKPGRAAVLEFAADPPFTHAMTPPFSGHCLCGAVRFTCDAPPLWQAHCHCESCRRATAAPFTSFFGMADGQWRWTGVAPVTYGSSPGVWRDFCGRCGTQMAFRSGRAPGECHFYAATLDDPTIFVPTEHDHSAERLPWVHLADGLPDR